MTAGNPPQRSRLTRDIAAVVLSLAGVSAVVWAAAATDWRLLLGVFGVIAVLTGLALAREV